MAMFVAFPSTITEVAFDRLHNSGAGAFGARPLVNPREDCLFGSEDSKFPPKRDPGTLIKPAELQ